MRATRVALVAAIVLIGWAMPRTVHAQWGVGGFVGREFDESDHWVILGAHAVFPLQNSPVVINPRFTYHSFGSGFTVIQFDVNVLYDFKLANPGLIRPYLGVGGGYVHSSFGSACTTDCSAGKLVADFVAGFRLAFGDGDSPIMPFVNSEYSFAKQYTNTYQLTVGFTYTMKKK
jgi:hypothetical protein